MSCTNQLSSILSKDNLVNNSPSSSQSYNDLINYCSIRKQLIRIVPQYMNNPNKKFNSNRIFSSDIEEFHKLKQEIITYKESISVLKEKKQQKLEQIEQLRCLMRKVGNKQNNYINNNSHNFTINNHSNRETKLHNNNDQRFRVDRKCDKYIINNNIKSTSEDIEGGLSGLHTTSGMSSGKDDDSAPKGDDYPGNGEAQDNFNCNSSSNSNSSSNNHEGWRCCFVVEEDNGGSLMLEKEN